MMLDIFEDSTQGKWLGLFNYNDQKPPRIGLTITLKTERGVSWKVKTCVQQRHNGQPVNSYTVVVRRKK